MNRLRSSIALLFILPFALLACSDDEATPEATATAATATATGAATDVATAEPTLASGSIVVSAASSLTDAFTEVAVAFEATNPGVTVDLNFGSSSELATQIVEGAPAEVFASANEAQMAVVIDAGVAEVAEIFAQNVIVVAVPADNDSVQAFEDIAADGVRLVLAGVDVPVGDYARRAISAASTAGVYGADFQSRVLANVVSEEPNVRAVLAKVELGEADAGIVYATDASISGDAVRVVEVPAEYSTPAVYPIAAVGENPSEQALAFVAFVLSQEGQAILAGFGFAAP